MGERSIEELVKAIQETRGGNKELFQQLEEKAKELGIRLDFWADDRTYYRVDRFGPNVSIEGYDGKWDTDGEPISPEEYLDALREFLVFELRDAEQAKYELLDLILRFTKKQAGHRDLKDAVK